MDDFSITQLTTETVGSSGERLTKLVKTERLRFDNPNDPARITKRELLSAIEQVWEGDRLVSQRVVAGPGAE
jgi:hypothetical protein